MEEFAERGYPLKRAGKPDSNFPESPGNIDPRHPPGPLPPPPITPLEDIPAAWELTVQDETCHTDNTPTQPLEDALTALVSASQDETCYTDNTAAKPPLAGHVEDLCGASLGPLAQTRKVR